MAADIEKYALVTIRYNGYKFIDIKVDRNLEMKKMITNLFSIIKQNTEDVNGFYVKAQNAGVLLSQKDSLKKYGIYDGEILTIL